MLAAAALGLYVVLWVSPHLVFGAVAYMVFPLAFIWFGDAFGAYASGWRINASTPGIFVKLVGWILLFLTPLIVQTPSIRSGW